MNILVAIANHGTKNKRYIDQLLSEYRSMNYDVDVVVLSNIPKDYGEDVEVVVGTPTSDPWSLPFGHKQLFADRVDEYDLFIYTEDDTLIKQEHVEAFLAATEHLPDNYIAGFLRYEEDAKGRRFCSSMHSHYHWDFSRVQAIDGYVYAYYTNEHSACFMLTRSQLKRALKSGGFLVGPHEGQYDLLCTAATDPYTQCGFTKVICISHIHEFLLHHLPNQYLGRMGLENDELKAQVDKLLEHHQKPYAKRLIPGRTGLPGCQWEMSYNSPVCQEMVEKVDCHAKNVLSLGVGQGKTEGRLIEKGYHVTAIPLDDIVGASAVLRGVNVLSADMEQSIKALEGRQYDAILFQDILCYLENPIDILDRMIKYLVPKGRVVIKIPNLECVKFRDIKKQIRSQSVRFNLILDRDVKGWMRDNHFHDIEASYLGGGKVKRIQKMTGGMMDRYISSCVVLSAIRD